MQDEPKQYYDAASATYSETRYEGSLRSYSQYVFRKRLHIFLRMMNQVVANKFSLFEIGCADGVIMRKVKTSFNSTALKLVGIDISPLMIEKARTLHPDMSFFLRGEEGSEKYDIVIELGVHTKDVEEESNYVKSHLKEGGYYIYSYAGRKSIHAALKLTGKWYLDEYKPYSEVEEILRKHFEIVESKSYGFFIPKLWSVSFLGRIIQPIIEPVLRIFTQELFHEKIYLLRNK